MATVIEFGYLDLQYLGIGYLAGAATAGEGSQIESKRLEGDGAQVQAIVTGSLYKGAQIKNSNFGHTLCNDGGPYLDSPYLEQPYLAGRLCAGQAAQIDVRTLSSFGAQVRAAIYNTTNLRIMCSFPTRGDDGQNWTASSTEPSTTDSFDINNVNTDVVEQVWRSATGIKTGLVLDCDAGVGQSIFMDTFALLNHNLTTSAVVNLIGSDNASHSPPGETIPLVITEDNFVYIADDLPLAGYRYWRLTIDDVTNSNAFVSIGTIVGGASTIFNDECFIDRVQKTPVNYSDTVFTEAFTNVQNDRGVKNKVRLDFRNIRFNGANWTKFQDEVVEEAKTILKCLWIPTPQFPLRFMTFAKLARMPVENHNVKGENLDFVNFTIETDESL